MATQTLVIQLSIPDIIWPNHPLYFLWLLLSLFQQRRSSYIATAGKVSVDKSQLANWYWHVLDTSDARELSQNIRDYRTSYTHCQALNFWHLMPTVAIQEGEHQFARTRNTFSHLKVCDMHILLLPQGIVLWFVFWKWVRFGISRVYQLPKVWYIAHERIEWMINCIY